MDVYVIDGTYELFRHFFAIPSRRNAETPPAARSRRRGASLHRS
jgi:hypothetical protein